MVTEILIKPYEIDVDKSLGFYIKEPLEIRLLIDFIFDIKNIKWTEVNLEHGKYFEGNFNSDKAWILIKIMKLKKEWSYLIHLTVLGGTSPYDEIARLCKYYKWDAIKFDNGEILDLTNLMEKEITDEDRDKYYDDYWEKFNKIQEEREIESMELKKNNSKRKKKWWQFW